MITRFKIFEGKKPNVDEKTFRVEFFAYTPKAGKYGGFESVAYIDHYFDNENRVSYIDNPWNIKSQDWYGLQASADDICLWHTKQYRDANHYVKCYNVLEEITKDYNL